MEVVASILGGGIKVNKPSEEKIRKRFQQAGLELTPNNLKSVSVPEKTRVYVNEKGSAPGFSAQIGRCEFFFFPGVPKEFYWFVENTILPWVQTNFSESKGVVTKKFSTFGLAESKVAHELGYLEKKYPGVILGYRAGFPQTLFKITRSGQSITEAEKFLRPIEQEVLKKLGHYFVGSGHVTVAEAVHALFTQNGKKLALAESCTGGLVSSYITKNAGSSKYFLGGAVTYSNELKMKVLGVEKATLDRYGAVSEECAREMALGALRNFESDFALSITGIAGPDGGSESKPVGLVCFALADRATGEVETKTKQFSGPRENIQIISAYTALNFLRLHLFDK
jgi:nicotinamide-nucleotide amidase